MATRFLFLLSVALVVAVTVIPNEVEAALPAQPCSELGKTTVSDDQQNMVACLYDASHNLVWKGLALPVSVSPSPAVDATPAMKSPDAAPSPSRTHWQGWYAGGGVGMADTTNSFSAFSGEDTYNLHTYGSTAGLVGGYNHVRSDGFFYGGEADVNYMSNFERFTWETPNPYDVVKSTWNGYATARGRIGVAFDPALVFLTGGLVLADVTNQWHDGGYGGGSVPFGVSSTTTHVGWTAGAGAEFALTNKISMSAQYLRLEMPESTIDPGSACSSSGRPAPPGSSPCAPRGC